MKNLNNFNEIRFIEGEKFIFGSKGTKSKGVFIIRVKDDKFYIIAESTKYLDKIIVSSKTKNPTIKVLKIIAKMFFEEGEKNVKFAASKKKENIKYLIKNKQYIEKD